MDLWSLESKHPKKPSIRSPPKDPKSIPDKEDKLSPSLTLHHFQGIRWMD